MPSPRDEATVAATGRDTTGRDTTGRDGAGGPTAADLPPLMVVEPGAGSPALSPEQWEDGVVALGRQQEARVPSYDDVEGFCDDHPGRGLLAFLIPGVEVQLCPMAVLDGGADPEQALRTVLSDHLDELSIGPLGDQAWAAHALGIHETGAVIIQDAVALRRDGVLLVIASATASALVAGVMQELLPSLAER